MKKKILFIYPELMFGGSTTSLISLLKIIDYNQYEVDIVLYRNKGEYFGDLPIQVNILPEVSIFTNTFYSRCRKIWSFIVSGIFLKAISAELFYKKKLGFNHQIMSQFHSNHSRKIKKNYNIAIGYLEMWADYYTLEKVSAHKKVIWIHIDYLITGLIPSLDYKSFQKADKIVCVSESCLLNFNKAFPNLSHKVVVFENILSSDYVKKRATDAIDYNSNLEDYNGIKLVTVCRLTIHTKGIDRSIAAAKKLKEEGYNFRWFIIGDGEDYTLLEDMIKKKNLKDTLFLLGEKKNPYPLIQKCDLYVMASRREGKPMAVTEAQILGLPIIVTNYASAIEQVRNDVDGIIVTNNDEGIYEGIKKVLDCPQLIDKYKKNLTKRKLGNEAEIEKFYSIID
ncbi:glycosyltransferase [Solibacillus cecembensis]|uniref:glycosyltransferase n=1 Tax=Solibacillus cecembensis TaxID=459347 RepID=UPI003D05DABB